MVLYILILTCGIETALYITHYDMFLHKSQIEKFSLGSMNHVIHCSFFKKKMFL